MKRLFLQILMAFRIYPHIHFTYSPFKILEFRAMMRGLRWRGDERVLDIGCGNGLQTLLIGQRCGQVIGLDINPDFVRDAQWCADRMGGRVRAKFLAQPLEKTGFAPGTFDRVFSICVIEHIRNYQEILVKSWQVLRPGGEMIFTVDTLEAITDSRLKKKHTADHHIARYFTREELTSLLDASGFVDIRTETLFRSDLARKLFTRGILRGFNFGRLGASVLARRLARAEADATGQAGLFLHARARKPS